MPKRKKLDYDPAPLEALLRRLLKKARESHREASKAAGLSPSSVSNYLRGIRPGRDACILLADHFDINPNVVLGAAGYAPLAVFDHTMIDPDDLSPDVKAFAKKVQEIEDWRTRRRLINAITDLIQAYLPSAASAVDTAAGESNTTTSSERTTGLEGAT